MPVTTTSRGAAAGHAPVIHLHQPQSPQPPWQGLAIAGALALQLALVGLIAWKTLLPPAADADIADKIVAAMEDLEESRSRQQAAELARQRLQGQADVLDRVVAAIKGGDGDQVTRALAQYDQAERLAADVEARDSHIEKLRALTEDSRQRLKATEEKAQTDADRLKQEIGSLQAHGDRLQKKLDDAEAKLAKYVPKKATDNKEGNPYTVWYWVGGAVLAAVVLVGGVFWIGGQMTEKPQELDDPSTEEPASDQSAG